MIPRFTTCVKKVDWGMSSRIRWGIFSCPSGANVSWSRAPPPKVMTTTFRLLVEIPVRAIRLEGSRELPSATPVALRKNSRRLQASCRASSWGADALAAARRARSPAVCGEQWELIYKWNAFRKNYDAAETVSRHPSDALHLTLPCLRRKSRDESRFRGRGILRRINKLTNFGSLLVEVGQVLFAGSLIDLELLLGADFLAGSNVRLAQPVVSVGEIGIEFKRTHILGDGAGIFILVGVEIAQLQVRFCEPGIERQRVLQ